MRTSPTTTLLIYLQLTSLLPTCHCYCTGSLRDRDIAGIWRLRSKKSFFPTFQKITYPMKEFTVFPIQTPAKEDTQISGKHEKEKEILLLLREDGNFVQYGNPENDNKGTGSRTGASTGTTDANMAMVMDRAMKGSWALVDGKLILAADRPQDTTDIRADRKIHDTILTGQVIATSGEELSDNPALMNMNTKTKTNMNQQQKEQQGKHKNKRKNSSPSEVDREQPLTKSENAKNDTGGGKEDVHLSVTGEISIGKFFYPQKHPSFFDLPMVGATPTGSFELQQILGTLNTNLDQDDKLVEKFRKKDLMDKKYFLTSYPLPTKRKKRQRWSIKYNKFVDDKPQSNAEKEREEREKNAPMQIKTFEVELFQNNTFATITGLGDTVLRGKWSIIGEERDQLWMSVWRFGFGRNVSGSTYSEGSHLTHQDDVSYWGEIYEVDTAEHLDSIEDDPTDWKGTKIEVNGAVMLGVGLEPCSIARFTMIEKTENLDDDEDDDYDDDDGDDDEDYTDELPTLEDDIGSFE